MPSRLQLATPGPSRAGPSLRQTRLILNGAVLHPLRPLDYRLALTLAMVLLLVGAWRLVPGVSGVFHDDAIYVISAKALADGRGYRLINLPGAPPQTKYPI